VASPTLLPPKKDVARGLLLRGTVFVHLDPRRERVAIPEWLRTQPQVVLQIGLDMPVPIPDLRVDDTGVLATLSFQRTPFTCSVPWEAVFALVGDDGKGMVWPDDLPPEIAAEVEREAQRQRHEGVTKPERTPGRKRDRGNGRGLAARVRDEIPPPPTVGHVPALALATAGDDGADDGIEPEAAQDVSREGRRRAARGAPAAKKKRRVELPPYLRIIK